MIEVVISSLTPSARLYLVGITGNSLPRANAVAQVVYLGSPLRQAARENRVDRRTLERTVKRYKSGMRTIIEMRLATAKQLAV